MMLVFIDERSPPHLLVHSFLFFAPRFLEYTGLSLCFSSSSRNGEKKEGIALGASLSSSTVSPLHFLHTSQSWIRRLCVTLATSEPPNVCCMLPSARLTTCNQYHIRRFDTQPFISSAIMVMDEESVLASAKKRCCLPGIARLVPLLLLLPVLGQAAGQLAPYSGKGTADPVAVPVSPADRIYLADQASTSVSVVDPSTSRLLGLIRLGAPLANALRPVYRGQVLVHGLGYSPDSKTLVVVCVGSNALVFVDTATNSVKGVTYVGRAPHEAVFTPPDGKELWVTIRGQDYIQVVDGATHELKDKIKVPDGPGMVVFSPDGRWAYVCSSFTAETVVIDTTTRQTVGRITQASTFCPNLAVHPDGSQVWLTLRDTGKVQVFSASPPFAPLATLTTGPITNHVNFASFTTPTTSPTTPPTTTTLAYVSVGGLNAVKVFTTNITTTTTTTNSSATNSSTGMMVSPTQLVATVPTGDLPHGLWPSGDGTRMWVGLENGNAVQAIDTRTNKVVATIQIGGQSPQAMVYVPNAVPGARNRNTTTTGGGGGNNSSSSTSSSNNLTPSTEGDSSKSMHLVAAAAAAANSTSTTRGETTASLALHRQGPQDLLSAALTQLQPGKTYALALAPTPDGNTSSGGQDLLLQPIASFKAGADGAATVMVAGPFRAMLFGDATTSSSSQRRGRSSYVVVVAQEGGEGAKLGEVVQVEAVQQEAGRTRRRTRPLLRH